MSIEKRIKYNADEYNIIYDYKISETDISNVYLARIEGYNNYVVAKINKDRYRGTSELKIALMLNKNCFNSFARLLGYSDDGKDVILFFEIGISTVFCFKDKHSGPISIERIYSIALQISFGLLHIHAIGYVHGDIKSSNAIMFDHGIVKLIDFGSFTRRCRKLKLINFPTTKLFLPPEYLNSDFKKDDVIITATLDVYAFGILLACLLLPICDGLELCIDPESSNIHTLTNKLDTSCLLSQICLSCMAFEKKNRPRDGGELYEKIEDACKQQCPSYYNNFVVSRKLDDSTKNSMKEILKSEEDLINKIRASVKDAETSVKDAETSVQV